MFAPTRVWRKWHVKTNKNQKRFAVVSALAATALPSLVMARGHRVEEVEEVPLVVSDAFESLTKTRDAVAALKATAAHADVVKVSNSRKVRRRTRSCPLTRRRSAPVAARRATVATRPAAAR